MKKRGTIGTLQRYLGRWCVTADMEGQSCCSNPITSFSIEKTAECCRRPCSRCILLVFGACSKGCEIRRVAGEA